MLALGLSCARLQLDPGRPPRGEAPLRSLLRSLRQIAGGLAGCGLLLTTAPIHAQSLSPELGLEGMTFVANRGDQGEVVVRAREATYLPQSEQAALTGVHATVSAPADGLQFEMTCDRGDLDLATSDFFAEGNVKGRTDDGRRFETAWVRYRHAEGLLFTDEPVRITDDNGSYEGGGFRYDVQERRFRLVGGARVIQQP